MDFFDNMWYSVTTMPKFLRVCLCYLRWCVSFQNSTDFLRSPSKWKTAYNGFRDFLSRCIHKFLIKMPWSKLDWNFIDLFRLWVSNSWPRHLVLLMHLLRKSRKPLQAVFPLDGILRKSVECWKDVTMHSWYGVTGKRLYAGMISLPVTPYRACETGTPPTYAVLAP